MSFKKSSETRQTARSHAVFDGPVRRQHASAVHREQRQPAIDRNDIWSMDFVADELADGRRFRALTILDLFTRECLAIDIGQGLGGHDVAAALERLRFSRGLPQRIYCDNG